MIAFSSELVILDNSFMALGGKHSLPGFDQSLEDLRADILMMAALVRRSLSNAKISYSAMKTRARLSSPMMKRWTF